MEAVDSTLDLLARSGFDVRTALSGTWMGIALWQYLVAFVLILLSLFARRLAWGVLNRLSPSLTRVGGAYAGHIITALSVPVTAVVGLIGIYLAAKVLILPVGGERPTIISVEFVDQTFQVAVAAIAIWAVMRLIDVLALYLGKRAEENDLAVDVPIIPLLRKSLKIFVGVVGGLFLVQNMGYPIASILGGLGIGGLAVALAAQDTLANVFGSVVVFTDKPFKVGDWVRIDDIYGEVESIGFRSTRIRTLPGTRVSIPNSTIAGAQIENAPRRRVEFTLIVDDESNADQMEQLVNGIREILSNHPGVVQEHKLVHFTEFSSDGLGIYIHYFTQSSEWEDHLQVRQDVNVAIMRLIEELGMGLSLPGTRIFLASSANEVRIPELRAARNGTGGKDGDES